MTSVVPFERSVFVNCPFDDDYAPIMQAIAFCITVLGFTPRIAPENADGSAARLTRILALIKGSKYGIHDLSRVRVYTPGEYARLNMPFELGLDHGSSQFGQGKLTEKSILVLGESRYDHQHALSDIAGWDIEAHQGNYERAIRIVRGWLIRHAHAEPIGATQVLSLYAAFQAWYWERELARGASEAEIREYPTIDFVRAMGEWVGLGKPI